MQEIELTCEVTSAVRVRLLEKLAGQEPESIVINEDRYYDTGTFALYEQAVFVRVRGCMRTTARSTQLQFKFDEPESEKQHVICTERAFDLSQGLLPETAQTLFCRFLPEWLSAPTWQEAFQRNRLQELACIHNTRHLYQLDQLTVCLDHVQDLGTFVDVEMLCEEGADTQQARSRIQHFVADIGGTPLSAGYVELSLQRYQPAVYQRGHYRL